MGVMQPSPQRTWDSQCEQTRQCALIANGNALYRNRRRSLMILALSMLQPRPDHKTLRLSHPKARDSPVHHDRGRHRAAEICDDFLSGSGRTPAVCRKWGRRWNSHRLWGRQARDYTIQKRMPKSPRRIAMERSPPIFRLGLILYNRASTTFQSSRKLPWAAWRFFALQLFNAATKRTRSVACASNGS